MRRPIGRSMVAALGAVTSESFLRQVFREKVWLRRQMLRTQASRISAEAVIKPNASHQVRITKPEEITGTVRTAALVTTALFLVVATLFAAATRLWVLTAIPIGFLFGFFLERSDLCGASAFSEVVLMRETGKVWGFWVAIVASMALFAVAAAAGLIKLSPKPLMWANYLVGGVIFGVGTVLAGGCVSGCLFKAAQGNLNSMAALLAMPIGIASVTYGPLAGLDKVLSSYVIKAPNGGPVTLSSLTGLPYWSLAILISIATLAGAVVWTWRSERPWVDADEQPQQKSVMQRILMHPWKPWHSGIAIGILALVAYTSSAASGRNYPLGVTHGVLHVMQLATESPVASVWTNEKPPPKVGPRKTPAQIPKPEVSPAEKQAKIAKEGLQPQKKVVWWLVGLVVFVVVGSHVSARMRGNFSLRRKPPDEIIVAFFGGLMVGIGATLATACVIGHVLSGVALMSVGSILFGVAVVLANWVTTYAYLMGGFSR